MTSFACEACRTFVDEGNSEKLDLVSDCRSSFRRINDYFTANLRRCPNCSTIWLEGYHEDFTGRPISAEWGKRVWIYRPLSPDRVTEIRAAEGTESLDISTFAQRG